MFKLIKKFFSKRLFVSDSEVIASIIMFSNLI